MKPEERIRLVEEVAEAINRCRRGLLRWPGGPVTDTDRAYARAAVSALERNVPLR